MIRIQRPIVIQAAPALIALSLGMAVYLLDRQPESVYFMTQWMVLGDSLNPFFGTIGHYLPAFVHVYAFILLTIIFVAPSRVTSLIICLFWFLIDSLFEIAQISSFAHWIVSHVPEWFQHVPILENTSDYFLARTFDVLDLYSIAAGTVAAYLTILISTRSSANNVSVS